MGIRRFFSLKADGPETFDELTSLLDNIEGAEVNMQGTWLGEEFDECTIETPSELSARLAFESLQKRGFIR